MSQYCFSVSKRKRKREPKKCVCGVIDGRCPEAKAFLDRMLATYEDGLKSVTHRPHWKRITILKEVDEQRVVPDKSKRINHKETQN